MKNSNPKKKINRRSFLKVSGATLLTGTGAAVSLMWLGNEYENPVVERVQIPIPNLPAGLEGFRIVQISDIHIYPLTTIELVESMAKPVLPTEEPTWGQVKSLFAE